MNRKLFILFSLLVMVFNSIVIFGIDALMKKDVSVYMIQVGRYQEEKNAQDQVKRLQNEDYPAGYYKNEQYVVYATFLLEKEKANSEGEKIAHKGITCIVKEYRIPEKYTNEVKNKSFEKIYQYLKGEYNEKLSNS